jgi:hypothetical protein
MMPSEFLDLNFAKPTFLFSNLRYYWLLNFFSNLRYGIAGLIFGVEDL